VVVMIEARRDLARSLHVDWMAVRQRLRISTTGLGRKAIEDRAATFDGQVRERVIGDGWRLLVSFLEPNHPRA
jgi:hypothetical protein